MLMVGCGCFLGIGSLSGVLGLAFHVPDPPSPWHSFQAGVIFLAAAAAFLVVGCTFGLVHRFLTDPTIPPERRGQIVAELLNKIPDPTKLLRQSRD